MVPVGQDSGLHKIRRAMVAPGRLPLAGRGEADETSLGAAKPGSTGRGAAGKAKGRHLGRLWFAAVANASTRSLLDFLGKNVAKPATVVTTHGGEDGS